MKNGIVLNRMYVGDYLMSNLGHEVINLYQADNGCNYIYLNSTGDFVKAHQGRVEYMLFVKYYGKGEVEVIGMAKGLEDVYKAGYKLSEAYELNPEIHQSRLPVHVTMIRKTSLSFLKGTSRQRLRLSSISIRKVLIWGISQREIYHRNRKTT